MNMTMTMMQTNCTVVSPIYYSSSHAVINLSLEIKMKPRKNYLRRNELCVFRLFEGDIGLEFSCLSGGFVSIY